MLKIKLTSDSTCDLGHLVAERDITLLPLAVNLGDNTYYDGVDITPQDIFDYVAKNIPDWDAESTLVVGDSLTSDIQGAINSGLDCCWFNPEALPYTLEKFEPSCLRKPYDVMTKDIAMSWGISSYPAFLKIFTFIRNFNKNNIFFPENP